MRITHDSPGLESQNDRRAMDTAAAERGSGRRYLIMSAWVALFMFAAWGLVTATETAGHHDYAELLPLFALMPLTAAVFHLLRARHLRSRLH